MKRGVLLGIVLVFCVNFLYAQTPRWANVTYMGENERILEGTAWILPFLSAEGVPAIGEFRRGGRLSIRSTSSMLRGTATWERTNDLVKFVLANGAYFYEGIYYPENRQIMGTLYLSNGRQMDFTMEPEGSFEYAPAPSTTPNITPPANSPSPAQSTPSPAQSTPAGWNLSVLSGPNNIGGTWTSSVGRGNFMVLNGNGSSGTVNVQMNGRASTGTVTVSGNTLNIYITSGQFSGEQFRYTIVSNRLIQGDGENFSR